jgi:hypothetical protein
MSLEIRVSICFLWLKNLPNLEISHKINFRDGTSVIRLRATQKWMHSFGEGEHSPEEDPKPISTKNGRSSVRGNIFVTLSSILTVPLHIGHREISITSESQDFLIHQTARISHHATSGYSRC